MIKNLLNLIFKCLLCLKNVVMPRVINFKRPNCILFNFLCSGRWRFLRKKHVCLCFACFFLILICTAFYLTFIKYSRCSFVEVEKAVFVICDKYQNREALGNLCADLCELNHLKPHSCLPNHLGKDVVFEAEYFGDHVVVKSSKLNYEDFDQIFYVDESGNQIHPSINMFLSMIVNTIQTNLDITVEPSDNESLELLTKIWTRNMKNFNQLPYSIQNAAMNNIWFLAQQGEYLLMKYYEDTNVFPKVMGTCGPFYAVEFIQPLSNYFLMLYPSWKEGFNTRAELALKILNFLEESEKHFPFLHYCDVKVGHFGLDKNSNIKLLDMDMVFFESSLIQNMVDANNCTTDEQCSFVDCRGSCDIPTHKCHSKVLDSNFQRVCINVFAGRLHAFFGLLSSPPSHISKELRLLLDKCSEQLDDKQSHILASQLKHLLVTVTSNQ